MYKKLYMFKVRLIYRKFNNKSKIIENWNSLSSFCGIRAEMIIIIINELTIIEYQNIINM